MNTSRYSQMDSLYTLNDQQILLRRQLVVDRIRAKSSRSGLIVQRLFEFNTIIEFQIEV